MKKFWLREIYTKSLLELAKAEGFDGVTLVFEPSHFRFTPLKEAIEFIKRANELSFQIGVEFEQSTEETLKELVHKLDQDSLDYFLVIKNIQYFQFIDELRKPYFYEGEDFPSHQSNFFKGLLSDSPERSLSSDWIEAWNVDFSQAFFPENKDLYCLKMDNSLEQGYRKPDLESVKNGLRKIKELAL